MLAFGGKDYSGQLWFITVQVNIPLVHTLCDLCSHTYVCGRDILRIFEFVFPRYFGLVASGYWTVLFGYRLL
jgi:hypothetical protein